MSAMEHKSEIAREIEVVDLVRLLSTQEDSFCMAVIEYSGNLKAAFISAYGDCSSTPAAQAKILMQRPEIAARINELNSSIKESALITIESHLVELANIRDIAKALGAVKVALGAEEARGKVSGLYLGKMDVPVAKDIDHLAALADRLVGLQKRVVTEGAIDVEIKTHHNQAA